ncbi:MAG TPA: tetratricopeptide repeat protein [Gammaproteobacteria bacterium]
MQVVQRNLLIRLAALSALVLVSLPVAAQRADDDEEAPPPSIGATTGRILNEAIEFLNMDDYVSAREALADLRLDRLSPYERSRVEQIFAGIDLAQDNYASARDHLAQAIAAGGLNQQETERLQFQIAQLYMTEEMYAEAAAALEEWFRTAQMPNAGAYYLLAAAYYQQGDLERALEPAQKAVELAEMPQVGWIELLVYLYVEREQYEEALPLVERLVSMEPKKKQHWMRLSSFYLQLERPEEALAAMQVAYNAGLFTEDSEYRRLADMLVFNEIPYRGARVLEKAIEEGKVSEDADLYEKLANCWIAARDFDEALPPLERAAELSDDGDLYVRLAEVNIQLEDWEAASNALRNAMDKGDLSDEANAQLLMGVALFNQDQLQDAREWFQRASRSDERRDMASDYIKVIDARIAAGA